jgi:type IV pilus assembly protein PilO
MDLGFDPQEQLDKIAKLPANTRLAIIGAIVVAFVVGYYFLFYQSAAQQLTVLRAREMDVQRQLNEVRSVAANLSAFEDEISELERKLDRALRQLPDKKELEVVLADISSLGKKVGVEIRSFQRANELSHGFYAEVPIEIELEGGYHSIAMFFDRVSKLQRIVNIGQLEVTVAHESTEGTELHVKGVATTFRFLDNDATEGAPPAAPHGGRA